MSAAPAPPQASRAPDSPRLEVTSPITGDLVGSHPLADETDVAAAVSRARAVSVWWADLGFEGRRELLDQWRGVLARRMAQLATVVHDETGKPVADAQLEIALTLEHLAWATSHASSVLRRRRVRPGLLTSHLRGTVERLPLGVVGVIGPWNYPVFTPMGSIAYAMAAGNAVVFKPSELTPGTGVWLADSWAEVCPERPVLQTVTGDGSTGAALCTAGVDKLSFTGSTATGRRVMAACAQSLTPVLIEAGGKDALLVDADADVGAAAEAAVWGAFSNAGQTCIGVERVYVHRDTGDAFLGHVTRLARQVRAGGDAEASYGPMTLAAQADVVRAHVTDALEAGGRALIGGVPEGRLVPPTVLVDVPEDSLAVTEETFGPTLVVRLVDDMDEAVALANAGRHGLGSGVFSRSRGPELARRLRCGMTSVNSVIGFAGMAALPFGGVGDSGFGRIHGADGLREFTYAKAVARQVMPPVMAVTTFARTAATDRRLATLVTALHGGASQLRTKARGTLLATRPRRRRADPDG